MRFGLAAPTGTEGLMYPVPYADPRQAVELAIAAERMGFDSVWANDHVTTQRYVRAEFPDPPRYYDPYVYLANVAAQTTRLGLATAITVMTFRHPVVAAKQAATLDQLSGGRFILGLGIGAYREETEAMWPDWTVHRGTYAREYIESTRLLLTQRRATYHGDYLHFEDVESFPKPLQSPLPLLAGGNAPGARRRAAVYADGWLPGSLSPAEIAAGAGEIRQYAAQAGRELPADFEIAPQMVVSLASTTAKAMEVFERSQLFKHLRSLSSSTLKGQQGSWAERNLLGSREQIIDQAGRYAQAGVTTFAGLLFAADSVPETLDRMQEFAEMIFPAIRGEA